MTTDSVLAAADEILKDSHDRHFYVVYDHLIGKTEAESHQLWLSVGYFVHGRGTYSTIKPWRNEEQLEQLLEETGRK